MWSFLRSWHLPTSDSPPTIAARFQHRYLPAPDRRDLLGARNVIGEWGHTEIDDLILEAGVEGLRADRGVGSSRDRANAILRFVLENPDAVTADNSLFSAFVVRAASSGEEAAPPTSLGVRPGVEPPQVARPSAKPRADNGRFSNRVFVVHGQDEVVRNDVVEYLTTLGLDPIVLHEQPNMGRHLLTKFVEEADLVTFAIVLMTGDDLGGRTQ